MPSTLPELPAAPQTYEDTIGSEVPFTALWRLGER